MPSLISQTASYEESSPFLNSTCTAPPPRGRKDIRFMTGGGSSSGPASGIGNAASPKCSYVQCTMDRHVQKLNRGGGSCVSHRRRSRGKGLRHPPPAVQQPFYAQYLPRTAPLYPQHSQIGAPRPSLPAARGKGESIG